jgi:signal transduction histidine kinase
MIEQIYPILILVGCTIAAVLTYLWLQARSAANVSLALIRLNEQLQFDTPVFLQNAWPLLAQGGLRGIAWQLDWFGVPLTFQAGESDGYSIRKEIDVAEMKLAITFQQYRHGERRYFDEALIETFLLLLRTDMWIKAGATDATFAQMSKLTLFLQHDMKNVAQFIQLMADQLAVVPAGKEQQVLNYLRTSAPLIRHRADRIVNTLTAGQDHGESLHTMQIADEVAQICSLYRLDCNISGAAQVRMPENAFDSALDNILKNYSDIGSRIPGLIPQVSISITENDSVVGIVIKANNVPPVEHIERLFEPFWSRDPAGLGIGLYQAKQMVEMCGGSISASLLDGGKLQFHVELPSIPKFPL